MATKLTLKKSTLAWQHWSCVDVSCIVWIIRMRRVAGDAARLAGFHVRNADVHVVVGEQRRNASDGPEVLVDGVAWPRVDDDVNRRPVGRRGVRQRPTGTVVLRLIHLLPVRDFKRRTQTRSEINSKQNWLLVKVLHPTRRKTGHFGYVLQANLLAWYGKKQNTFTNQKKCTTTLPSGRVGISHQALRP